jgi:hypothetical protein
MAAIFWLLVLGAGVMAGQPWAWLILGVILVCFALARPVPKLPPPPPRPVKAPVEPPPPVDPRQLKRRWRQEDLRAWQEDFDRLVAGCGAP